MTTRAGARASTHCMTRRRLSGSRGEAFIEDQQVGVLEQSAGNVKAALLAVGELPARVADHLQQTGGHLVEHLAETKLAADRLGAAQRLEAESVPAMRGAEHVRLAAAGSEQHLEATLAIELEAHPGRGDARPPRTRASKRRLVHSTSTPRHRRQRPASRPRRRHPRLASPRRCRGQLTARRSSATDRRPASTCRPSDGPTTATCSVTAIAHGHRPAGSARAGSRGWRWPWSGRDR